MRFTEQMFIVLVLELMLFYAGQIDTQLQPYVQATPQMECEPVYQFSGVFPIISILCLTGGVPM